MSEPIKEFTAVIPYWEPRIEPVVLDDATEEQLDAMKVTVSNTAIGAYTLALAHDPETLNQRTPLFNGIMYSQGGLSRAETEMGAVAASVVNRCIYCAAVHANRYNQLTKDEAVMDSIFASGEEAELDPRLYLHGSGIDPVETRRRPSRQGHGRPQCCGPRGKCAARRLGNPGDVTRNLPWHFRRPNP